MPMSVLCCYAHEDEDFLKKLKGHLRPLQHQQLIDIWDDRSISAGTEWNVAISERLKTAQIILLLVSPDFINSDYCYGIEMQQAIERHERKEAHVIPIILRPSYWQITPLGTLQVLPTDGKPINDPEWHNQDRAFLNIAEGIKKVIEELLVLSKAKIDLLDQEPRDMPLSQKEKADNIKPVLPEPHLPIINWKQQMQAYTKNQPPQNNQTQLFQFPKVPVAPVANLNKSSGVSNDNNKYTVIDQVRKWMQTENGELIIARLIMSFLGVLGLFIGYGGVL